MSIKKQLVQLAAALLIIFCTPSIIGFFNQNALANIRANSPYVKTNEKVKYDIGRVISVDSEKIDEDSFGGNKVLSQKLQIQFSNSENPKGKIVKQLYQTDAVDSKAKMNKGDELILRHEPKIYDYNKDGESEIYTVTDKYRFNNILWICLIFIIMIFALAGIRGLSSLVGMAFSFIILTQVLIPGIINGTDLLALTFGVGLLILSVTMYIGHGFTKKTTISLAAGLLAITLATFVSGWVVDFTFLSGFGSEDAFHLKGSGITNNINLRGLLVSGIIIGAIGIMDDVTIAQAVAIEEISKANTSMTKWQLFWRGMAIGQDHIISLINTLVLAYVGTALPLVLSITVNNFSPFWVIFSDQMVAEEIVRSLIGSMCILLAIPITNGLAAYFLKQEPTKYIKPVFSLIEQLKK